MPQAALDPKEEFVRRNVIGETLNAAPVVVELNPVSKAIAAHLEEGIIRGS